jgi:5-methylcytosine-specific restriction endonuclease McrA
MIKVFLQAIDGKKERRRIPSNRRKIVYKRDGKRCRYCHAPVKYHLFHLDHIKPVYHTGHDYVTNLCVACESCNMKKGANKRIKPPPLPFWRKIYGILLIIWFRDYPRPIDFF